MQLKATRKAKLRHFIVDAEWTFVLMMALCRLKSRKNFANWQYNFIGGRHENLGSNDSVSTHSAGCYSGRRHYVWGFAITDPDSVVTPCPNLALQMAEALHGLVAPPN